MTVLNESLDYMDMVDQIGDTITIDEYSAKMGKDKDIVTVTFTVHNKLAAEDLVTWFERGYDFVLDASVSEGELEPGKWLVFAELDRRSKVPNRIITLLSDLETLTDIKLKDWKVEIEGDECEADEDAIRELMILNPNVYKDEKEEDEEEDDLEDNDLNEMKIRAGIDVKSVYVEDEYIKNLKAIAGM
jgi:hypothetical protein